MTKLIRLIACAGAACLLSPSPGAAAEPCERLAAAAARVDRAAWTGGSEVLRPWLEIHGAEAPKGRFKARLARAPAVRKATANGSGSWPVYVDRLPGTDIYAASTSQGTAHCQVMAFLRARPGRPIRFIKGPASAQNGADDGGLCWTRSGAFGRIFGQPAYFEHGANNQTTDDEDIRITPWANGRWGAACTLKLRYQPTFTVAEHHCRDASVCKALDGQILAIAGAYHRHRQENETSFRYGPGDTRDEVKRAIAAARPDDFSTPDWPGFGDNPSIRPMSYSGATYFSLTLDGGLYAAAIGHQGVGWREGGTTLLILFALEEGRLVPQASYAVDRHIAALASVSAD
jgi:hypothetical protein